MTHVADTFTKLGPNPTPGLCDAVTGACLIDNVLSATPAGPNAKSGYQYWITPAPVNNGVFGDYVFGANSTTINSTGTNNFCTMADAVIRSMKSANAVVPQLNAAPTFAGCQAPATYATIQ